MANSKKSIKIENGNDLKSIHKKLKNASEKTRAGINDFEARVSTDAKKNKKKSK